VVGRLAPHEQEDTVSAPEHQPEPDQPDQPEPDAGMATAEYAIATLAACGFAALLVTVLGSDQVRGMLLEIVQRALALA
jgi:hypothetical protein